MLNDNAPVRELLQPFFERILQRDHLGTDEQKAIASAAHQRLQFSTGEDLVLEGSRPVRSLLLVSGFACRYRQLASGERQITAIHLPGDFVDLHSFLIKEMDHSVGALTDSTVVTFPHVNLVAVTERFPHLTRLLWLMTLLDGAIHREWLVGMGRLPAPERTAHLICELYIRLKTIGLADRNRFLLPITQAALADALGISAVHINRVLQELRQKDMISWEANIVEIRDWDALA
ncbi:MAG: Crp/Fnr family transcriptional regulator, partial [Devosia sp.]